MKKWMYIVILFVFFSGNLLFAESSEEDPGLNPDDGICYIGSSMFLLGNLLPGDPPYFGQINFGYELSSKDIIFIEAITWAYYEPLGTYGESEEKYPGKVQSFGVGIGYQRLLWKGLFAGFTATPFVQNYYDEEDQFIQRGFQLYLQTRLGYRFEFLKHWFIEPSIDLKWWPIDTNLPEMVENIENGTPKYRFEPGLHFGFRF